jgi:hypothetical protein
VVSEFEITYGDLMACGYLMKELGTPAKAIEWCEKFPGCMSASALLFLQEAEKRSHYHQVLPRRVKPDAGT